MDLFFRFYGNQVKNCIFDRGNELTNGGNVMNVTHIHGKNIYFTDVLAHGKATLMRNAKDVLMSISLKSPQLVMNYKCELMRILNKLIASLWGVQTGICYSLHSLRRQSIQKEKQPAIN